MNQLTSAFSRYRVFASDQFIRFMVLSAMTQRLDLDDLAQYDVEAMPTLLFFREGALVTRVEALVYSSELEWAFEEAASAEAQEEPGHQIIG